jgi:predicted MFS family arabinose efflux permease
MQDVETAQDQGMARKASQGRREALILLILASAQFTSIVDFMVVMPLGPQLMRKLTINPFQFGLIVSSYTLSAGLAGFLASSFLDRYGRKAVFLTLYAGFLLGTLMCGLVSGYFSLLAARVLTGAFGGLLGGLALAIVGDVFPEERRGRATGVLMSAFALASVAGVPTGIYLGNTYGWQVPFLVLAALATPVLLIAIAALPALRDHLRHGGHAQPFMTIYQTFSRRHHLRAFALTMSIMLGGFAVIPYVSVYLVSNAGVAERSLPLVFVTGGLLTLVGSPLIGRLADHHGKLPVFRIVATVAAVLMVVVTNLPRVPLAVAVGVVGTLMLCNAGRMVAALAMVTGSVATRSRGGFMSANSAVQQLSAGLGAYIAGRILVKASDGSLQRFDRVGWLALVMTLLSLWLAGRVRPAPVESEPESVRRGAFPDPP